VLSEDTDASTTTVRCKKALIVDLGIGMLQEDLGEYEAALRLLFPRWTFTDIVKEWCVKFQEQDSIGAARRHQAKPLDVREPFERPPKPTPKYKLKLQESTSEPTRCSKRRFGDVPASVLIREGASAEDPDASPPPRPVDTELTTPEVLKRRASVEAGESAGPTRMYDSVLRNNSRLIDEIAAADLEEKTGAKKRKVSYVISRSEHDVTVKDLKSQIRQLKARNCDLIDKVVQLKGAVTSPLLSLYSPDDNSGSSGLVGVRMQLEEVKQKFFKLLEQKNRLVTSAASVAFESSEANMKILRDCLKTMFTDQVTLSDGMTQP
jgi:hypothetical protein